MLVMKYKEILLKDLMAIYEKRDANSSNFKTKIKIKITKEKYPKYFETPEEYDEAIKQLEKLEYVFVKKVPHDTVVDNISLNLDKIDEIKRLLGIEGISEKRQLLLAELNRYDDDIIVNLKNEIIDRINKNKSIKQYLSNEYIDAIKAVHYLENLDHNVYERNASNYIFNDSKKLAKVKMQIESIYNDENIFEKKGIMSITPYLYVKGEGIIYINSQKIDLKNLANSIGIPIDKVDELSFENISKVTTIENLTTFYDYVSDGLIIYLGGFSTRSQIQVLKKIKEVCKDFYHFGDIDYGGFTILNNLMEELNLDIKAVNMNLNTLINNLKYTQSFDNDKYIDRLKTLLSKPLLKEYFDVIQYMIDNKVWLEQESFYNI